MKPGPAPMPTAIRRLAGNPSRRPLNDEPVLPAPASKPYAPRYLNAHGQREWRRIVQVLIDAGLYTDADHAALEMYCQAYGRWVEAEEKLAATGGPIIAGVGGGLYQNPWLHVANRAHEQVRQMLAEFGLTPAQRSRVVARPRQLSLAEMLFSEAVESGG